ncbi:MAG: GNAT family N-acetyltransferase [Planctomycetota bacterium]|jgi:ribosomal protein S18 acetylase RimI-like enzyme
MESITIKKGGLFNLLGRSENVSVINEKQVQETERDVWLSISSIASSRFCTLEKHHAKQVAQLHIEGISTGFISSLGVKFVTALYEAIIENGTCYGFVTDDDKVVGFVAFTTNLGHFYKSIILKKGFRFAFLLARKMLSLKRIKRICETLFYPNRIQELQLPEAELLSIAIAPAARRMGLASRLVENCFAEYQKDGLGKVKVLVDAENKAANRLYQKCGFEFAEQIENHGVASNIYIATLREPEMAAQEELRLTQLQRAIPAVA